MHEMQLSKSIAMLAMQSDPNIINDTSRVSFPFQPGDSSSGYGCRRLQKRLKEYGHEWWIGNLRSDVGGRHRGPVTFFFTTPISAYILRGGVVFRFPT